MTTQTSDKAGSLRALYPRLIALNAEAFAGREYDVAYHVLMAALHCVQRLQDVSGLGAVKRMAEEQLAWIDLHHPEYGHSTQSAQKRRQPGIYHTLALQAGTMMRMIQAHAHWQAQKSDEPDSER
jgi:hypothetical protein